MTSLQVFGPHPYPVHQGEQQHHGARNWLVVCCPAANRALGNVEEARTADLREAVAVKGRAEGLGVHSGGLHGVMPAPRRGQDGGNAKAFGLGEDSQAAGFVGSGFGGLASGHFNLQRASVPFRMTTTLPDKMSGCQARAA